MQFSRGGVRPVSQRGATSTTGALPRLSERMLTQQGLPTAGRPETAARQVQDRSYFIALLRNRSNEITKEINKMKSEIAKISSDSVVFEQLQKRHTQQSCTIRSLEGDLADLNLALDKFRAHTPIVEVRNAATIVKARNELATQELDTVFTNRKHFEKKISEISDLTSSIDLELQNKLLAVAPDKGAELSDLRAKHDLSDLPEIRAKTAGLRAAVASAETRLHADPLRAKLEALTKTKARLTEERQRLLTDAQRASLTPSEQREILTNQIKQDTEAVAKIEAETTALRKASETVRQRIAEIDKELSGLNETSEEYTKLEILLNKDREIEEFLRDFEANKAKAVADQQNSQAKILQHLEVLSRTFQSAELAGELAEEASLAQIGDSVVLLKREIAKRRAELEKLEALDPTKEIAEIKRVMEEQKDEIANKFSHVNAFVADQEREIENLVNERIAAEKNLHLAAQQTASARAAVDALRKKAEGNPDYRRAREELGKIAIQQEKIGKLKEELFRRTVESDYSVVKKEAIALLDSINSKLISN